MIELKLKFPPSANRYWRNFKGVTVLSDEAKLYRVHVYQECLVKRCRKNLTSRLAVELELYPDTRRKFDIDNRLKPLIDAFQHAGVYADDEQIDELTVRRMEKVASGNAYCIVRIKEIA